MSARNEEDVGADLVSARNEEDVGARCIVPKVNGNNTKTERAQFIVPLQNHKTIGKHKQ